MTTINSEVVARLLSLADELPKSNKEELCRMIKRWGLATTAVRPERSSYTDSVSFVSTMGTHHGRARNLSESGVFLESYDAFKVGDKLSVTLILITSPEPIQVFGVVKRIAYDGIGVQFYYRNQSEETLLKVAIDQRKSMLDMMDSSV